MEVFQSCSDREQEYRVLNEMGKIVEDGKLHAGHLIPDASDIHFLDVSPELVLTEAKRLNLISESTYRNIIVLQKEETNRFKTNAEVVPNSNPRLVDNVNTFGKSFEPGKICYFMNRFIITWEFNDKISRGALSDICTCGIDHNTGPEVRNMCESDWLYLAELSKYSPSSAVQQLGATSLSEMEQMMEKRTPCLDYASVSAQKALRLLKYIPVAARRSLPVLVNQQGQLRSIPVS